MFWFSPDHDRDHTGCAQDTGFRTLPANVSKGAKATPQSVVAGALNPWRTTKSLWDRHAMNGFNCRSIRPQNRNTTNARDFATFTDVPKMYHVQVYTECSRRWTDSEKFHVAYEAGTGVPAACQDLPGIQYSLAATLYWSAHSTDIVFFMHAYEAGIIVARCSMHLHPWPQNTVHVRILSSVL